MLLTKKNNYKPLYKKFLKLKENIQNRKKILTFKKQKWKFFIQNYKKKLKYYNKYKLKNQANYTVLKFANKKTSYSKRYLYNLQVSILFKLFYGGIKQKSLKKNIKTIKKHKKKYNNLIKLNLLLLKIFEKRLDTILYRAKFTSSIRNSRQLISHNKIFVNNELVKSKSAILKFGDLITVDSKYHNLIRKNIQNLNTWPIPPKNLIINYKTLQIIFLNFKNTNFKTNFNYNLNLEKINL